MDIKVGDLVSIKSDFPGRNFNIDYLSSLKRNILIKKVKKLKKTDEI